MKNIIPRIGVSTIIVDKNYRILLGLRNPNKPHREFDIPGANTWCLPGGRLDYGETLEDGAIREVYEECGFKLSNLKYMTTVEDISDNYHWITVIFEKSCVDTFEPILTEPDSFLEWKWFELHEIPTNLFSPTEKALFLFD